MASNVQNPFIPKEFYESYEPYTYRARDFFIGFLVFLVIFVNYIITLTPSVAAGDHGELATTTYALGAPHPSGYPIFAILGKFFSYLPFGNVAYRVNLMSAFAGALTVFVFFMFALKILGIVRKPTIVRDREGWDLKIYVPAILASLVLGFSNLLWNQSIIGEVYSLHSLLNGLVLIALILWYEDVAFGYYHYNKPYLGTRYLVLLFFLMGLSLTDHHLSAGYIIPISVIVVVLIFSALYGKVKFSWGDLLTAKGGVVIGFLLSLLIAVVVFYFMGWAPKRPLNMTEAITITLIPFLPISFAGIVWWLYPERDEDVWIKDLMRASFWALVFFLLPIFVFYGYLLIRSIAIYNMPEAEIRVLTWGEIRSLDVLWTHILRKQYGAIGGVPVYYSFLQLWEMIKLHLSQFHILLYLLLIPGFIGLFKKDINFSVSLVFVWFTFLLLFSLFIQGEPVARSVAFWSVFLLQSYFIMALVIAQGMQTTMDWVQKLISKKE